MFRGKKIYDITRPIHNKTTVWPGDDGVCLQRTLSISEGGMCNVSRVEMGVHTGTHMDAPLHFLDGGEDIAGVDLDKMLGEAVVFETYEEVIEAAHLQGLDLAGLDAIFFKTRCSNLSETAPFLDRYPAISKACAEFLVEKGIKTVGTDYFSIECGSDNCFPVHKYLLSNKVAIIENVCLKGIEAGLYSYVCLPLKMKGSDGSPCRALLFK